MVHMADAVKKGFRKILLCTVDTNVVIVAVTAVAVTAAAKLDIHSGGEPGGGGGGGLARAPPLLKALRALSPFFLIFVLQRHIHIYYLCKPDKLLLSQPITTFFNKQNNQRICIGV